MYALKQIHFNTYQERFHCILLMNGNKVNIL